MLSGSSWQKLRKTVLALFFPVQYHYRMAFLALHYKCFPLLAFKRKIVENEQFTGAMRALKPKAVEGEQFTGALRALKAKTVESEPVTGAIRVLKAKTIENEQFTGALRAIKQAAESERLHTALQTAKKRLTEMVIVEEAPEEQTISYTQEKLKNAWKTLETAKIPRVPHDTLKNAWQALETGKLPRLAPETFAATRHPLKTLKEVRHDRATLIALGLTVFVLVALFTAGGIAGRTLYAVQTFGPVGLAQLNIVAQRAPVFNASKALVRLSQLDENEYASQTEYDMWAYSACSTASMTEVFNSYGHHYRITDVLKVENAIGAITPQLGLLHDGDIAKTAAQFDFHTHWGENWTLDQVLSYANAGEPVIVDWPPDRYPDGHIVVVTGGNAHTVDLADSSLWDRQAISRAQFMKWWGGFAAVVTPA